MKILTQLFDDNDNLLAGIETRGDLEAHEEKLYKIQCAIDEANEPDLLGTETE